MVAGHVSGATPLAGGLDLYYALERATSLVRFHTMLREGERNRTRDGLQQTYGDHNRLLMLALDRLLAGDVEWLRDRVATGRTVDEDSLRDCAAAAAALDLPPDVQVALWLGAALHDCGMLCGQGSHVDVEDGLPLARPLLEQCCPESTRPLAEFVLRHHDYVKETFLGEAPVGAIADDLATLDPDARALAVVALGLIQVAGASSLGTGRLTDFRLDVFHACLAGTALADRTVELRLARLLAPGSDGGVSGAVVPDVDAAAATLADVGRDDRPPLEDLLRRVFVHGWHAFAADADPAARLVAIRGLATGNRRWEADHLVLSEALRSGDCRLPDVPNVVEHRALSGSRTVTLVP